jgi:aldehyde:ferredoxin oxidoreductase
LVDLGKEILSIEHQFNLSAGSIMVERLPEFFEVEPLPPHGTVYDVKAAAVASEIDKKLKPHL